jgi:IK cytokine
VEEQRRYLGGDKDHTILVKGLDFALLEQNKARAMLSHEDDDSLEAAFQEAQPKSLVPVKRTREDLIRELKEKRALRPSTDVAIQHPVGDKTFEEAKKVGKFRPIGASDHLTAHEIRKRPKGREHDKADGGDRKKKRRKVKHNMVTTEKHHDGAPRPQAAVSVSSSEAHIVSTLLPQNVSTDTQDGLDTPKVPVLEHISLKNPDDEVDIFVDAGEYEGVDFGEDEDEEHDEGQTLGNVNPEEHMMLDPKSDGAAPVKSWFIEDEPPSVLDSSQDAPPSTPPIKEEPVSAEPEEPEHKPVNRLVPLASSALPSIGDFLAMDAEAEAQQKRKAKKEKRTGREKKDTERTDVKVDRDYKRSVGLHMIIYLRCSYIDQG